MTSSTAEAVFMDPDCLQTWPAHINDTTWQITTACARKPSQMVEYWVIIIIVAAFIIFIVFYTYLMFYLATVDTVDRLRLIPSYELHETIEAMHEKSLRTTQKATYREKWKGRYTSIEYVNSPNGHGGTRKITIVEDLLQIPKTQSMGLSKIAVDKSTLFGPMVPVVREAPTRPTVPVPPPGVPMRSVFAAPEDRQHSVWDNEYLSPPAYTS